LAFSGFNLDIPIPINVFNYLIMENNNNNNHKENHHVVSYAGNITVWVVLLIMTWLTITVAYLDFGNLAVAIALLIATVKAGIVLAYYMHLRFDSKLLTILLLVTMGVFSSFIILTFFDYAFR